MEKIEEHINSADETEMERIIWALLERNKVLHPDDELVILSLPKADTEERRRLIDLAADMLMREYR